MCSVFRFYGYIVPKADPGSAGTRAQQHLFEAQALTVETVCEHGEYGWALLVTHVQTESDSDPLTYPRSRNPIGTEGGV